MLHRGQREYVTDLVIAVLQLFAARAPYRRYCKHDPFLHLPDLVAQMHLVHELHLFAIHEIPKAVSIFGASRAKTIGSAKANQGILASAFATTSLRACDGNFSPHDICRFFVPSSNLHFRHDGTLQLFIDDPLHSRIASAHSVQGGDGHVLTHAR